MTPLWILFICSLKRVWPLGTRATQEVFFFVALVALPAGSKKKQAKQVADSTCRGTGRVRDTGLKRRYGYGCCNHDENSVQAIYGSHPYTQTSASLESCKGKHFTTKDL